MKLNLKCELSFIWGDQVFYEAFPVPGYVQVDGTYYTDLDILFYFKFYICIYMLLQFNFDPGYVRFSGRLDRIVKSKFDPLLLNQYDITHIIFHHFHKLIRKI